MPASRYGQIDSPLGRFYESIGPQVTLQLLTDEVPVFDRLFFEHENNPILIRQDKKFIFSR
jgi:hypothetical protein